MGHGSMGSALFLSHRRPRHVPTSFAAVHPKAVPLAVSRLVLDRYRLAAGDFLATGQAHQAQLESLMIMIDSKAGQRFAKAQQKLNNLNKQRVDEMSDGGRSFSEALNEYCLASNELGNELIAAGHADAEDYS